MPRSSASSRRTHSFPLRFTAAVSAVAVLFLVSRELISPTAQVIPVASGAKLIVEQKPLASSDSAVENQKDVNLLRFEARANQPVGIQITNAVFSARVGSVNDAQRYALWVDTNDDRVVDTVLQTTTANNGLVRFDTTYVLAGSEQCETDADCPNGQTCSSCICSKSTESALKGQILSPLLGRRCQDSDGGRKSNVRGTTTNVRLNNRTYSSWTDTCLQDWPDRPANVAADSTKLLEGYCISAYSYGMVTYPSMITCSLGCMNGVCRETVLGSVVLNNNQVEVKYAKTYSGCAQLMDEKGMPLNHEKLFCNANETVTVSAGKLLVKEGQKVKLCRPDKTGCSELVTVTRTARCGDGTVQPPEQCDDGNSVDTDACSNACIAAVCGDGVLQDHEECERNVSCKNGGVCEQCRCSEPVPACGNGVIETGEQCEKTSDCPQPNCINCPQMICTDCQCVLQPIVSSASSRSSDYSSYYSSAWSSAISSFGQCDVLAPWQACEVGTCLAKCSNGKCIQASFDCYQGTVKYTGTCGNSQCQGRCATCVVSSSSRSSSYSSGSSFAPCKDSDGGKNYTVRGETFGVSPSTGEPYSGEDVCGSADNPYAKEGYLVEHYCDRAGFHTNEVVKCPNGCGDGACKPEVSVCGNSLLEAGEQCEKSADCPQPNCVNCPLMVCKDCQCVSQPLLSCGNARLEATEECDIGTPCKDGRICELGTCLCKPAQCGELPKDMNACLDQPNLYWDQETGKCTATYQPCSDPDGGQNPSVQGHTFGFREQNAGDRDARIRTGGKDSCISETMLREHYCNETYFIRTIDLFCPQGCDRERGVCKGNASSASSYSSSETCARDGQKVYGSAQFGPTICCSKNAGIKPSSFLSEGMCVAPTDGSLGTCVENWWRTCGDKICTKDEDQCNCPKDCSACTQAGDSYVVLPGSGCCAGLTAVNPGLSPLPDGSCLTAQIDGVSLCINCGDGVCGKGENKCNCPKDCGGGGPLCGNGVLDTASSVVFEVHADIGDSLAGSSLQLQFDSVGGEETVSGRGLTGLSINGTCNASSQSCEVELSTVHSTLWNLLSQGNLFVTLDVLQSRSRQLLGGTLGDAILRLKLHAELEPVDVTLLTFVNGSDPSSSIDALELYKEGADTPFTKATTGACGAAGYGQNVFCARMQSSQLVVGKDNDQKVIIRPRMKTDTAGGLSGQDIQLQVFDLVGVDALQARGVVSSNTLLQNDGDSTGEGEIFIGRAQPGPSNVPIIGAPHTSVLSKIISISNGGPVTGTVPAGVDREIGSFTFTAAPNVNSKNGLNEAELTGIIFTVNATNVELQTNGFSIHNKSGSFASNEKCVPFSLQGTELSGPVSGIFLLQCDLSARSVNTAIDSGQDLTLVVAGNVTNVNTAASTGGESILQVSLNNFSDRQRTEFGPVSNAKSFIRWDDLDFATSTRFLWVEYPDTVVNSTIYHG